MRKLTAPRRGKEDHFQMHSSGLTSSLNSYKPGTSELFIGAPDTIRSVDF